MSWFQSNKTILALAPMADLTDSPFSQVCRSVSGTVDFVIFREMVSAEGLVRQNTKTLSMCSFLPIERPLVIQIFGGDADNIARAAAIVMEKFRPDGIDVNMGCPVPKISGRSHAGAALLKDPVRATRIVSFLKKMNLGVPVSVKTRLGWANAKEIFEFARRLEQAGADLLTVHGRTKMQGYSGCADWDTIRQIKDILSVPLIANGDICSWADIKQCLQITRADGVMIGRAALGNPWIFAGYQPNVKEIKKIVLKHASLHLIHYGSKFGLTAFRKHLLAYFKGLPHISRWRILLAAVDNIEQLQEILNQIPD